MTAPPRANIRIAAFLATAVALVHGRSLLFGFTSLDDLTLLVDDRSFLESPAALWRAFGRAYFHVVDPAHAYYRPVVTATYAVDTLVFRGATAGFHATNLVLHVVVAWLVHGLLSRLRVRAPLALAGALAFAVHPVTVPVVAWIPGRNDSLLAMFALLSLLALDRATNGSRHRRAWLALHLVALLLALFTKETAVVVPLLALACARTVAAVEDRSLALRALVAPACGWVIALGLYAFARSQVLPSAVGLVWDSPLHNAGILVAGVGKALFPVGLAPIATGESTSLGPGLVACAIVALAVALALRTRRARRVTVAFGLALYFVPLLPASLNAGALTLENRLYLPLVGLTVVAAELASAVRMDRATAIAAAVAGGLALTALAIGYEGAFADPLSFGKEAVRGAPRSALAHFTLGRARHLRGDLDGALSEYRTATMLDSAEPIVHNNIAVIHMHRAEWAAAERELEAELAIDPSYAPARENLERVRRRRAEER